MSVPISLLSVFVLLGSGLLAGVLVSVALGVVPAFSGLPPRQYIRVHVLAGQYYDLVMPPLAVSSTVADLVLVALVPAAPGRVLFLCAALLQVGVSLVSQFGNVPINRVVKRTDPSTVDDTWTDPRAAWRRLHSVRTTFAVLAFCCTACAVVVTH